MVFVSDSVSFGRSSSLSISVNLHVLRSRWQATKIVLEFARANFWLSAENRVAALSSFFELFSGGLDGGFFGSASRRLHV